MLIPHIIQAALIVTGVVSIADRIMRLRARHSDTLDNTTDEHSEWLGIGAGDIFNHSGALGAEGDANRG